jgi:hypothetical protein
VVGLGAQDDLGEAEEFVRDRGTTFTMLWDPTFESWANLGVALQPSAILLDPDGRLLGRWAGEPPAEEILDLVRGSASSIDRTADSDGFCRYASRYLVADEVLDDADRTPVAERQRIFDDIRFASTAMAQTASSDTQSDARNLANAAVALAAVVLANDLDLDRARAANYDELRRQLDEAAAVLSAPVADRCGISFEVQ